MMFMGGSYFASYFINFQIAVATFSGAVSGRASLVPLIDAECGLTPRLTGETSLGN